MKLLITIWFLIPAVFATSPKPLSACKLAAMQMSLFKTLLEDFKKDCRQYPARLLDLIEKPDTCMTWGGLKGPYIKDAPENREMLTHYIYELSGEKYELTSIDCPKADSGSHRR